MHVLCEILIEQRFVCNKKNGNHFIVHSWCTPVTWRHQIMIIMLVIQSKQNFYICNYMNNTGWFRCPEVLHQTTKRNMSFGTLSASYLL